MTDPEITALAREYAEEMIKGKPAEELPNCLKNSMLAMNTEYVAEIFHWLTRHYCLVEKSKVKDEYDEARIFCEHIDPCGESWDAWHSQMSVIERLFPEIAKEVENDA